MSPRLALAAAAGMVVAALACPARADKIDGSWCDEGGQRLSIDGPAVVTPGGNSLAGEYSRHFFSYVVPDGEPNSGATIQMRLLNEETMQRRLAGPAAAVETWHRCGAPVS